jgi:AraC-like DNA-binding protein
MLSAAKHLEFHLAVVSGKPVDENGSDLFEQTRKQAECLCSIGIKNTIYLDSATIAMYAKEHSPAPPLNGDFTRLNDDAASFLIRLYNSVNILVPDPDSKSDNLYGLLALSKSQAYRKIKSLTGMAPNQLIQEVRLRRSLKAIKNNGHTIAETAFDLGFNSPTYFAKVFKKRFGFTPTDFSRISK